MIMSDILPARSFDIWETTFMEVSDEDLPWAIEEFLSQGPIAEKLRTATVGEVIEFRDRILSTIKERTWKDLLWWWNVLRERHYSVLLLKNMGNDINYDGLLIVLQNMEQEWLIPWIFHIKKDMGFRLGQVLRWNWPQEVIRSIRWLLSLDPNCVFVLWIWWSTSSFFTSKLK